MASSGGIWAPVAMRMLKNVVQRTTKLIKLRIKDVTNKPVTAELQPILVRSSPRHPIHPAALLRQNKGRWYTTQSAVHAAVRRFMSTSGQVVKYDRASFPKSNTSTAVSRLTTRAPFASTLRPNLTGGALPRTAGGYGLGGGRAGARYFSHSPAAPAQVVNNVSQAVRAFFLSGQKAQFDGMTPMGEKRYRAVSSLQEETTRKIQSVSKITPGSYIDFSVNPNVTALSPLAGALPFGTPKRTQAAPSLNTSGFLDILSIDFSRALKDLAVIMNDLKKLSSLGDLPITLENGHILRVRFPGCDAESVENLCEEVGIQRGIVYQDADFDAAVGTRMALLFPFAPTAEGSPSSLPSPCLQTSSPSPDHDEYEDILQDFSENPWIEGYETMEEDVSESGSAYFTKISEHPSASEEYEGLEGIYKFLEECDARRS
ncbi:hypothetical protein DSL72_003576 [Monilinia vaccinii-corymbosi]|uniref:Casein kinase II beta 2 subunit n=1 Tax=Monilinia vaccinii-corymbosi TaxID=61207 RepID=A0A8A3P1L9_9HELO|nr:hypothetical protein DSL72_003576 [Monilinia vaccinii-corymbosi]